MKIFIHKIIYHIFFEFLFEIHYIIWNSQILLLRGVHLLLHSPRSIHHFLLCTACSSSCHICIVTPITSYPCSFNRYAATEESTPPDISLLLLCSLIFLFFLFFSPSWISDFWFFKSFNLNTIFFLHNPKVLHGWLLRQAVSNVLLPVEVHQEPP